MSEDRELLEKLNRFEVDVEKALDDTVRVTAMRVLTSATESIRNPSVGTFVKRYNKGQKPYFHVASKEGDAPNTDTGRLIGSIKMNFVKGSQSAEVGTNLDYGAFLETEMDRPWLLPALNKHIGNFQKQLKKVINLQIKKAAKR